MTRHILTVFSMVSRASWVTLCVTLASAAASNPAWAQAAQAQAPSPSARTIRGSLEDLRHGPLCASDLRQLHAPGAPSTGTRRSAGRKVVGGVLGAIAGGLVGAKVGGALDNCARCEEPHLGGAITGGKVGIVIGGLVGVGLASR